LTPYIVIEGGKTSMAKETNLEMKVGLFVVTAFIALTVFIFSISDFSAFEEGRKLKVVFQFANGLKKSAPVRFAGVDAGIVKDITIFFDRKEAKTKVAVECWLKKGVEIPVDSQVTINQLGLLGEKYIEVMPGLDTENFLDDGDQMVGKDPIAVEKITEMISDIAKKAESSLDGFNKVVLNEKNQQSVEKTLEGLSLIVDNVKEGKGTVGKLFYDESIFNNLNDFTTDLKANPWKLLYRPKSNPVEKP
jgi:phospholipid/cholesterol/gamma-HCH transport system substrate-binding protein